MLQIAKSLCLMLLCFHLGAQICWGQTISAQHAEEMKQSRELFAKVVRPAFVEHCLKCHGGAKTRGDLSLATRAALLEGGESGAAVDLKSPAASLLLEMVESGDMPPQGEPLPRTLVANIKRWVELGAAYDQPLVKRPEGEPRAMVVTADDRDFWSFRPLEAASPPAVRDPWIRTDVDRFVYAKLKAKGLTPNASAEKRTLARRAALDLIGMPPSDELLNEFLQNEAADAWEAYLDDLLASAEYGPRWARYWMDVARFAESTGFEHDYDRNAAYHYRDFLIQAFNQDLPWDTFVRWQLAGDEIAPNEPLAQMATGFLAAGVFPTQLTEAEFESARYDEIDDMLSTTGMAFLGLTIGCARCHDHKYDPIPTRDYYSLAATFARTIRSEKSLEFDREQYERKLAQWRERKTTSERKLDAYVQSHVEPAFAAWLKNPVIPEAPASTWGLLKASSLRADGAVLTQDSDYSILATGPNPNADQYTFQATVGDQVSALRLETLTHSSLPRKGPGRAGNGNFQLSHISVRAKSPDDPKFKDVVLQEPRATHQQNQGNLSIRSSLDSNRKDTGWAVDAGGIGKDQAAIFPFAAPLSAGSIIEVRLVFAGNGKHNIGRFRLAAAANADADFQLGEGADNSLAEAFTALEADQLEEEHRSRLREWFAARDAGYRIHRNAVDKLLAERPTPTTKKVLFASEGVPPLKHHADGRGYPHFYPEVFHLEGGDVKRKGDAAVPRFLEVLQPRDGDLARWRVEAEQNGSTTFRRTSLAKWLTDAEAGAGHLLARVVVNRLWQHHFGRGIVATPNDFGLQGEAPSHPELLDWLARDLIENGWRLKRLHRLIMTSAVYRQSSAINQQGRRLDPENRLLWRYSPRRLEAEAIRDSLLAVSGLLDKTPYGPGSRDPRMTRRSIYFTIKRSAPPNAMIVFDWPEHLVSIGRRSTTTIAPQSLHFMNSPQVRRYAEGLANRAAHADSIDAQIRRVFELAYGREPTAGDMKVAKGFLKRQASAYGENPQAAKSAMIDFCQSLLASNEFLYLP